MNKNLSASVRDRLLNLARQQNRVFDEIMTMYMLERLLYRVSCSRYRDNFILKGGLQLCVLLEEPYRTTKDIDFLAMKISAWPDDMETIFREICDIKNGDGLDFVPEQINTERIREGADYEGIRLTIGCQLGQARKKLQIDIGFGDIVTPNPSIMRYPTLLDTPYPEIWVYSLESIVAEKLEAMIKLDLFNSRMKDFYDIYVLSDSYDFDGSILNEAISKTFQKRGTFKEPTPVIFSDVFWKTEDKQKLWLAFLNRTIKTSIPLEMVMNRIRVFLYPQYRAILDKKPFTSTWKKEERRWIP